MSESFTEVEVVVTAKDGGYRYRIFTNADDIPCIRYEEYTSDAGWKSLNELSIDTSIMKAMPDAIVRFLTANGESK